MRNHQKVRDKSGMVGALNPATDASITSNQPQVADPSSGKSHQQGSVRHQELILRQPLAPTLQRLAYSLKETAAMLGISYMSTHRLLQRGLLKSSTALRHKVIPLTEIQRFLKDTTH